MIPFVSFHHHTEYSILDGMSKIEELVKKANEYNLPSIGITDHGSLSGLIEFYTVCREKKERKKESNIKKERKNKKEKERIKSKEKLYIFKDIFKENLFLEMFVLPSERQSKINFL